MQFLFNLFNHSEIGRRSLEDPMSIIGNMLKTLGHKVVWMPDKLGDFLMQDSGYNIIVEGFTEYSVQVIAEAHSRGARFICIATEEPTPKGFNHGKDLEMIKRQTMFPEAAKFFDGIFYLVPGAHVHNWFAQLAPTAYVELGYAPGLMRLEFSQPTHDFGFFGSMSPRRMKMLKRIARYMGTDKCIRIESKFPSQLERDKVMREAKVILQVRKHDAMGLVSSTRCNTALCLGRPVVAEPHELCKPWDEVVVFGKDFDDFLNRAYMMRINWRSEWHRQFEAFKTKFSPEFCIGRALKEIGVVEGIRKVS